MKCEPIFIITIGIIAMAVLMVFYHTKKPLQNKGRLVLEVPYAAQAPYGEWKEPWDEACEETSVTMVKAYYNNKSSLTADEIAASVQEMIRWEEEQNMPTEDTNALETVRLIESNTSLKATIKIEPSIDDIKQELRENRPVIALVDLYALYEEKPLSDSYHVLVIKGYDDKKGVFIVNDPARSQEEYRYQTLMNSLHDFNKESKEADGIPTVLFTKY